MICWPAAGQWASFCFANPNSQQLGLGLLVPYRRHRPDAVSAADRVSRAIDIKREELTVT